MATIEAVVRNGRIEVDEPLNLPDGTKLTIQVPTPNVNGMGDPNDTPEAQEEWVRWYDSLEPLEFTPEEYAAWQAARREQKELEFAQWDRKSSV